MSLKRPGVIFDKLRFICPDCETELKTNRCSNCGQMIDTDDFEIDVCPGEVLEESDEWRKVEDFIISRNYTWTYEGLKHDYQNYYTKGAYCSHTFLDVVKHNEAECKFLFGGCESSE